MEKRLAAGAALGILIAFSVYRNGSGMIVSLGALIGLVIGSINIFI